MKLKKITEVLIWFTLSVSGGTLVLSGVFAWQFLESGANHWFLFGTFWDRLIQFGKKRDRNLQQYTNDQETKLD